jgi:hypothetical protein
MKAMPNAAQRGVLRPGGGELYSPEKIPFAIERHRRELVKMFTKEGVEMMDVKSIDRDGENLVMKGKMMGTMYAAIYLRPQDLWQALRLMPASTLLRIPLLLLKGFWRNR